MVLGFIRLNQGRQNLHLILLGTAWLRIPQLLDLSQCSAVLGFGSDRTDFHCQLSHSGRVYLVVFRVRQHVPDINAAPVVVNRSNYPEFIAAYVKHRKLAHLVGGAED